MSYAVNTEKIILNPGAGLDLSTSSGVFGYYASKRPWSLLGFGLICTLAAAGTETTDPIIRVQKGPLHTGGITLADVTGFTVTPTLSGFGLNLGDITEVSALLKAVDPTTGAAPAAPNAYIAPVDFAAGDVAALVIHTAASFGTTEPKAIGYLIVAPYGGV